MYRLYSKLKHNYPRPDTTDKDKQASLVLRKETSKAYWAYLVQYIERNVNHYMDMHNVDASCQHALESRNKHVLQTPAIAVLPELSNAIHLKEHETQL